MKKVLLAAGLMGVLVVAGAAFAADSQAVDLLGKLETKYASIQTVSGSFVQVRDDKAFGEKMTSTANFYLLKPNNFRAEYQAPDESVNLISGEFSYRYVPKLRQVERYRFRNSGTAQDLNFMLLGFGVKTDDVLKSYNVNYVSDAGPGRVGVRLTPRNPENAAFKNITVAVDAKTFVPEQFSMEQLDGVTVTATLQGASLQVGAPIDKAKFTPRWPREAEVVDIQ
ncbi:hypothetical protein CVU37_07295 [candidate division BRC1 bacterium HGW-BRC1-1]|nr:MAG: hypothetical protein CVU37_07295 [candidate division BRC1 bacterium HGW-BRC1-1]